MTGSARLAGTGGVAGSLPQDEVEDVLSRLRELLSDERWAEVDAAFASEALLGWEDLHSLASRGVTVGSHTHNHAVLHQRQEADEILRQVRVSKATIEERLGAECATSATRTAIRSTSP